MPQFLLLVIPMAMLLGTSARHAAALDESEITAMKAGGISLGRIVAPLLLVGFVVSLVALAVQELFVPLANDRAAYVRQQAIEHVSAASWELSAVTALPGGGKQVTIAGGLDVPTQTLLNVTVIRYDAHQKPQEFVIADSARYAPPTWTFHNATTYHFAADGSTQTINSPTLAVDIGERPNQIAKQTLNITDPEQLSRAEIKDRLDSGQLSPEQRKSFTASTPPSWPARSRRSCSS